MTYKHNFVVAIRANNKILKDENDTVQVPFGAEYEIVLKNLNTVRAQAKVEIDGEDASGWLILQPNGKLTLERFIKNNNLTRGNKFKFISRNKSVENHRGIGIEDGIVKITYKFEKVYQPTQKVIHKHHYNSWYPYYPWYNPPVVINTTPTPSWNNEYTIYNNSNLQGGLVSNTQTSESLGQAQSEVTYGSAAGMNVFNCSVGSTRSMGEFTKSAAPQAQHSVMLAATAIPENTAGITVPGSESSQTFYNTSGFVCEASEVIVLKLVGSVGEAKVTKAITVDVKPKCVTCGRINRFTNKFCSECGTALKLY